MFQGKTLDRAELSSLKPTPKMRPKGNVRPRPKTIHIDSGSVQIAEGMSSRGKKGSASNLTGKGVLPTRCNMKLVRTEKIHAMFLFFRFSFVLLSSSNVFIFACSFFSIIFVQLICLLPL